MSKPFNLNLQLFAEPAEPATGDAELNPGDAKLNVGDILRKYTSAEGTIDVDKAETAIKSAIGRAYVLRTRYNAKLAEIDTVTKEKEALEDKLTSAEKWHGKYDDEHKAFEKYKGEQAEKENLGKLHTAYKALLRESDIDPELHDTIIRATDFSGMTLGEDGKLDKADDLKKAIGDNWAKFKVTHRTEGASVETPLTRNGPTKRSRDEIMQIKDTGERQKAIAENHDLFGF